MKTIIFTLELIYPTTSARNKIIAKKLLVSIEQQEGKNDHVKRETWSSPAQFHCACTGDSIDRSMLRVIVLYCFVPANKYPIHTDITLCINLKDVVVLQIMLLNKMFL